MKKYGVETHDELLDKLFEEASSGKPSSDRLKSYFKNGGV